MTYHSLICTLLLFLYSSIAFGQTQQLTKEEVAQHVQHLMDVEVGFENMVPPGVTIEAKEISRTGHSGSLLVKYSIFVKGAPADAIFKYINWPANADKPTVVMEGVTAGKDGLLICAGRTDYDCGDPKKPDDPIDFILTPLKGEPFRIAFVAGDFKVGTVIVPDPVENTDKGCTLSAVRLTSRFELAFITGKGYPPDKDIHYRVTSGDVSNDFVIKSDAKGVIRTGVTPNRKDKEKGTSTVKVVENACSPEVTYPWGKP